MPSNIFSRAAPTGLAWLVLTACAPAQPDEPPTRPDDTPALHHTGLNSTDPDAAAEWYLRLWPDASSGEFRGRRAVVADMLLVIDRVAEPPTGAFDPALGRPADQSAFWHIGAFVDTSDGAERLGAIGLGHLRLFTGPDDEDGVWRSGLTPYSGIRTAGQLAQAEPAEPRPGGFSYVLGPDGALFELTGGPSTDPSLSHVHLFHEQPQCAANWYVEHLGMSLPPVREEGGVTRERPPYTPCEAEHGEAGWPSLEQAGTIRQPRATVVHADGSLSFYPRQCVAERCGTEQPLVTSRGQVLDHVGFVVRDLDAWHAWLTSRGVVVLEGVQAFEGGRSFLFEGPDRLALELVELDD